MYTATDSAVDIETLLDDFAIFYLAGKCLSLHGLIGISLFHTLPRPGNRWKHTVISFGTGTPAS